MIQLELQFIGLTKRHCPVCGKEVVSRASKVYCSRKCYMKAYRRDNPAKIRRIAERYYQANRDKVLERSKKHHQANKGERNECQRRYRQNNPAKVRAIKRKYYQANLEHAKKYGKEYRQSNARKIKEIKRKYYQAHPEAYRIASHRRRARKLANGVEPTHEHRTTMVNPLTRQVCHYCGKDCTGDFHWDHFIPISKGGPEAPWNLVVSCPTCNLSKSDKLPESVFCDELGLVT